MSPFDGRIAFKHSFKITCSPEVDLPLGMGLGAGMFCIIFVIVSIFLLLKSLHLKFDKHYEILFSKGNLQSISATEFNNQPLPRILV